MLALTNAHGKNDGDIVHQHVLHELAWIEYGLWLLWLNVSLDEKNPSEQGRDAY
jgi:uncharacterized membrane protein